MVELIIFILWSCCCCGWWLLRLAWVCTEYMLYHWEWSLCVECFPLHRHIFTVHILTVTWIQCTEHSFLPFHLSQRASFHNNFFIFSHHSLTRKQSLLQSNKIESKRCLLSSADNKIYIAEELEWKGTEQKSKEKKRNEAKTNSQSCLRCRAIISFVRFILPQFSPTQYDSFIALKHLLFIIHVYL